MKYNILIHSINWIGLGHINRTVLLAKNLVSEDCIWNIIFVTNSKNPFLITEGWFKIENLDYWIEDTLKDIEYNEFEHNSFIQINKIINNNNIDIIIHDTYFIKTVINNRVDLKHFLILRDSNIDYLISIKNYLYSFKKIYIPHIKQELSGEKLSFFNEFKNIVFIDYIVNKPILNLKKVKKIIISPWYWWDFENTLIFFKYVNNLLLKNSDKLVDYKIVFVIWKHYNEIINNVDFIDNWLVIDFYKDLNKELVDCELFIWRWWYNTLNEVIINNCKSLLFEVERFSEKQWSRIDFFINNFSLKRISKWVYSFKEDSDKLSFLLNNKFDDFLLKYDIFNWKKNFINSFLKEINKPNILVFKHIFLPKSENFIYEELIWLNNCNPIVFTLKKENNDLINNLQIIYFNKFNELLNLDYPRIKNIKLYWELLIYIAYLVRKYEIKLIYTEFLFDWYFICKLKQILPNLKIISAWRWYDVYSFLKNTNNPYNFLNSLDKILVRDFNMKKNILDYNISENKVEVVRSVMNFSKYKYLRKNFKKLDIIFWWRFTEKKGILELIDLVNLLKNEYFIWNIWLIWEWELKNEILNKITTLWLSDRIKYYDFLSHNDFLLKINEYNCFINYSKVPKNWDNEWTNNIISENILSWNIVFSTIIWWIWEIIIDNKTWIELKGIPEIDYIKIIGIFNNIDFNLLVDEWIKNITYKLWNKNSIEKLENIIKWYI